MSAVTAAVAAIALASSPRAHTYNCKDRHRGDKKAVDRKLCVDMWYASKLHDVVSDEIALFIVTAITVLTSSPFERAAVLTRLWRQICSSVGPPSAFAFALAFACPFGFGLS